MRPMEEEDKRLVPRRMEMKDGKKGKSSLLGGSAFLT